MQFNEGRTVGIDLGTTFSTLAYMDDEGNPVPVPNDDGAEETPSLVLLAESGHVIVGPSTTRAAMEDPEHIVDCIKRHMGEREFKRTFDGHEITPEFVSALILKKVRQDAEQRIGKIANAVITVPYYFNDARRKATQDAGQIAGLNVVDIINEPTAATLTYAWDRGELGAADKKFAEPRKAMVYDLGGGTFDVTLVRYTPTHFQVLATDGDVHLGGIDWNQRLVDFVAEAFQERHGMDPRQSASMLQMLRNDCDLAKIALSRQDQAAISCRYKGKAVSVSVTREQFETMTADLLQRTVDTMDLVLEQGKMGYEDLDAIVLVGGSTLMPKVASHIKAMTGKEPYRGLSPHTSVAQGAAIHAAILEAKFRGQDSKLAAVVRKHLAAIKQEEVNSHGLGVVARNPKTGKPINHVMIPRNTRLPVEVRQTFYTNEAHQQRVNVKVTEGDAPDPAAVSLIGNCRVSGLPSDLPKRSPIEIVYSFAADGRIRVRAIDQTGGNEAATVIDRRAGLNEEQIDAFGRLAADYKVE